MAKEDDPYMMSRDQLIRRVIELEGTLFGLQNRDDPSLDGDVFPLQVAFNLTAQQAKFLFVLADGRVKSRAFVSEYCGMPDPGGNQNRSVLHRLRLALKPHGVTIQSVHSTGIFIGNGLSIVQAFLRNNQISSMSPRIAGRA